MEPNSFKINLGKKSNLIFLSSCLWYSYFRLYFSNPALMGLYSHPRCSQQSTVEPEGPEWAGAAQTQQLVP